MGEALHDVALALIIAWLMRIGGWRAVSTFCLGTITLNLGELLWPGTALWLGQQTRAALIWVGLL